MPKNFSLKAICLELRMDKWEEEDVEVRMCPEIGSEEWELGRREVGLRAHMHMVTCAHGVLVHREGVSLCTLLGKICIMQIHPFTSQFPSCAHILMYIELRSTPHFLFV